MHQCIDYKIDFRRYVVTRGVKKNRGTGIGNPGNRGPGSGSGLEKSKTGYLGSSTQFLVPGFYREPG
jgi:hypothetical protein